MSAQPGKFASRPAPKSQPKPFTPTELKVMHLIGSGLKLKQAAHKLGCSHRTIEVHFNSLKAKIGVRGVVKFAIWYAIHWPENCGGLDPELRPDILAALHSVRRARQLIGAGSIDLARAVILGAEALLSRHAKEDGQP